MTVDLFPGFQRHAVEVEPGVVIHARSGGSGPPVLLLHGHPQTQAMWHHVAVPLAGRFTVVLADLRGYGESGRPPAGADSAAYSKRRMAQDQIALMQQLGFARFQVGAHDRGARVAHRLALDHPQAVQRLLLLDIAPTLAMYEGTTEAFARAYWHWFFLIQPAPLPERLIEADPVAYLHHVMSRPPGGLAAFAPAALAAYEQGIGQAGSAAAMCADYRASAGVDLEHDRADRDAGVRVTQPMRVLWGAQGVVERCFDPLALWRDVASDVSGCALPCGHYIAEERPQELLDEMQAFFQENP